MSSFDQVIRNILADIFAEEEQQEVTRPKARPEGLMSSTRPRARPEDVEPVQPSASESTSKFVAAMSDYDDTPEEGVEIPLAFFKGTARDLEGRYKTTGMQLAKLNKNRGDSNIKVAAVEEDTTVDDLLAELEMSMKPMLRPRARPKSAEEIQTIRAEQASYTKLDTVKDIQQALNIAGIEVGGKPLVVDGIKGRNTLAAIKAFQKREGLKVDGIVGKNTKAALYRVMPKPEIKEEELQPSIYDKPAQVGPDQMQVGFQDPSIVDPTTSRPYTPEALMRREQRLIASADSVLARDIKEVENISNPSTKGDTTSVPTIPTEVLAQATSRNLVDKAIEHGHIVGTIRGFITNPSLQGLDFLTAYNRYGGYTSKLSELDPEGAAVVSQMGVNATGGAFNAAKDAWCALYIDGLLSLAGAERIAEGETAAQAKWKRLSALAYKDHGSFVTGSAPSQEEFNEAALRGDIVVIHSSFKITAKGNNVFYDSSGNVIMDEDGEKPLKTRWVSFKDMQKNEDGSYSYNPLDSLSESMNRLGKKQGLMLPKTRRQTNETMTKEIARYNGNGFVVQNQYHVGVNVGPAEDGFLNVLGGNQENRVSVRTQAYPVESIVATRRVTYKDITPEFNEKLAINDPAFSAIRKAFKGLFD